MRKSKRLWGKKILEMFENSQEINVGKERHKYSQPIPKLLAGDLCCHSTYSCSLVKIRHKKDLNKMTDARMLIILYET